MGEALAMAVFTTIAFAAFFLENDYLVTFHEGTFNLANNFCSFNGRSAYLNGTVGINQENFFEVNYIAFFYVLAEIVDIQEFTCFCFELLSLNFYNCVHLFNIDLLVNP